MRTLEARFHPQKKAGTAMIIVGRVHCNGTHALVTADRAIWKHADAAAMMTKLQFLVDASLPRPYEHLLELASDFWSFVEVEGLQGGREC